jgi:osmotically inducible protein OsmC
MDPEIASLLTELVEKAGLLRGDMKRKGDLDKYEARLARIGQKLSSLAERISRDDPGLATKLRTAWQQPGRSLAFRNVDHQHEMKARETDNEGSTTGGAVMATFARHADVEWTGGLLDGAGTVRAGSGTFSLPVTFPSRIAAREDGKTTPEEFMAASHAVCYAMVLTSTIGKQGGTASRIRVTATVTADKSDAGIKVTSSHLKATVEGLQGIEKSAIQQLASNAEKGCPISNAIRGSVAITVEAQAE